MVSQKPVAFQDTGNKKWVGGRGFFYLFLYFFFFFVVSCSFYYDPSLLSGDILDLLVVEFAFLNGVGLCVVDAYWLAGFGEEDGLPVLFCEEVFYACYGHGFAEFEAFITSM